MNLFYNYGLDHNAHLSYFKGCVDRHINRKGPITYLTLDIHVYFQYIINRRSDPEHLDFWINLMFDFAAVCEENIKYSRPKQPENEYEEEFYTSQHEIDNKNLFIESAHYNLAYDVNSVEFIKGALMQVLSFLKDYHIGNPKHEGYFEKIKLTNPYVRYFQ